jgi:hypothetical protein
MLSRGDLHEPRERQAFVELAMREQFMLERKGRGAKRERSEKCQKRNAKLWKGNVWSLACFFSDDKSSIENGSEHGVANLFLPCHQHEACIHSVSESSSSLS